MLLRYEDLQEILRKPDFPPKAGAYDSIETMVGKGLFINSGRDNVDQCCFDKLIADNVLTHWQGLVTGNNNVCVSTHAISGQLLFT